ncbi:MAG: response regulator transcription factor [Spirochaetes bacterium]|jgi:DNA-binding NarL/FixJ family response regulator|nr:response regulator transcription factor [Spirochaetota bacterium]
MAETAKKKKIFLVDDHPVIRQGIRQVVESHEDLAVCGEASNADDAVKEINKLKPDLVIADIMLEGSANGIDLVKSIRERFPDIYTIVLSMHDESLYAERAIRAGARGYIMKEVAPKNIIEAIRTVLGGELYLSESQSKKIIDKLVHGSADTGDLSLGSLSDREIEIFQLLGNGFSTKEIAKKLNLSIYTVESHKRNIKTKMKLKNSSEVIKHAIQWVILQSR